jgi:hypothetical protein
VVFAGILVFSLCLSGCGYNLEYRLPKGDVSKYALKTVSSSTNTMGANKVTIKQEMEAEITQKIVNVDKDSNLSMEVSYGNIKTTTEQDGKPVQTPPVKDTNFEMKMSKKGKLLDFVGDDPFMEENMKKFSDMKAILPDKTIKVGEIWKNSDSMDIPFPPPAGTLSLKQNVDNVYTFESVETVKKVKCAKIKIETNITQKLDPEKSKAAKDSIDYTGKGTITGYFYFGIGKGKIIKTNTDMTMNSILTVKEGGKGPQKVSNDVKSSMNMELAD